MPEQFRLGALCWLMSVEFFAAQFIAQLAAPEHNIFLYDISLLGISTCGVFPIPTSGSSDIICSPLHLVFNFGIILQGTLIILGVWMTRDIWPKGAMASWGLLLLALGGIGAMTVGAYPVDGWVLMHTLGAIVAIAAPGLGFVLLAATLWNRSPGFARWTGLLGVVVLLGGLGHALGGIPFGRGTMERLAVWPQTLWFIAVGAAILLSQPARSGRAMQWRSPVWPQRTGASAVATLPSHHV